MPVSSGAQFTRMIKETNVELGVWVINYIPHDHMGVFLPCHLSQFNLENNFIHYPETVEIGARQQSENMSKDELSNPMLTLDPVWYVYTNVTQNKLSYGS